MSSKAKIKDLEKISTTVRRFILESTTKAGSGHPTSSLSAVELMVALMFGGVFRADLKRPAYHNNDRLIFSKGHAAPLLYSLYAAAKAISERELKTLRQAGSRLEGHPMPQFPYAEAPTGSLGQGLSVGLGIALAAQIDNLPYRTYVLLGDGEMAEGSNWEAIQFAGFRKLKNLTAILDVNGLGQSGPPMLDGNIEGYAKRIAAFGWKTIVVDGHELRSILSAYHESLRASQPVCIIAKTVKGKGVSFLENNPNKHGKTLTPEELSVALQELPASRPTFGRVLNPVRKKIPAARRAGIKAASIDYTKPVSPRKAIGESLARLAGRYPEMIVIDGDVKNSTYTDEIARKQPKQFLEAYIAEQNMVGMAAGFARRGKLPLVATFGAFLTRAHDQLRMAQYAGTDQVYIGTHAGVSIGADGASQMALDDISMFRALQGSTVLYPADTTAAARLTEVALRNTGITYLRATRGELDHIYTTKTTFSIGGSHTLLAHTKDELAIVTAGITVFEALKAAKILESQRIAIRVIDAYSIKPIDEETLLLAASETGRILVVEDHYSEGGIADAVRAALSHAPVPIHSLAVTKIPHSALADDALRYQGLDAESIARTITTMLRKRKRTSR